MILLLMFLLCHDVNDASYNSKNIAALEYLTPFRWDVYCCADNIAICRKTSSISRTKPQHLNVSLSSYSCLCPIHWSQVLSREWICSWSNGEGDAPTTSEWSTILLPTKVRRILEVWWYFESILIYGITTKSKETFISMVSCQKCPISHA